MGGLTGSGVGAGSLLAEISRSLFVSLPRADQRKKGVEYVRGLLETPGRKSIRNMAHLLGGRATDQSLHHFISESTWDWTPVRQALAQYLVPRLPVAAWVMHNMVIRKAGQHSVGVDRKFVPAAGRVLNAQQAIGVWAASGDRSSPVNWGLHLPQGWIEDAPRRSRASIPENAELETLADRAAKLCIELVSDWAMPVRPVVFDSRLMDVTTVVDRLGRRGIPFVARIEASVPLTVTDPALTGHCGSTVLQAAEVIRAAKGTCQPVRWREPGPGGTVHSGRLAHVAVKYHSGRSGLRRACGARQMMLLGLSDGGGTDSQRLWLTDMLKVHPAVLLKLCALLDRVEYDFGEVARNVGIEDYAGRSFDGWHRHVTLASAAHAVSVLTSAHGTLAAGGRA